LLFCAVLLVVGRLHLMQRLVGSERVAISFGAGMATAYSFVHVMPALSGARHAFAESTSLPTRYEGMAIFHVSLIGFLLFYGLDHLVNVCANPRQKSAWETHSQLSLPWPSRWVLSIWHATPRLRSIKRKSRLTHRYQPCVRPHLGARSMDCGRWCPTSTPNQNLRLWIFFEAGYARAHRYARTRGYSEPDLL
jgi:hypothetical protein